MIVFKKQFLYTEIVSENKPYVKVSNFLRKSQIKGCY